MRVLITGASGYLGAHITEALKEQDVVCWAGSDSAAVVRAASARALGPLPQWEAVDLTRDLREPFLRARPDVVIHAAARSRVADCAAHPAAAHAVNDGATRQLAELAALHDAHLVYVSTDLVFDGEHAPYSESDAAVPLSMYGRSKLAPEDHVMEHGGLVARVSLLFGPSLTSRASFFDAQCRALEEGTPMLLFADEWRTPIDVAAAADALIALSRARVRGRVHVGGPERMSRLEIGERLARCLGYDPARAFRAAFRSDMPAPEPRPRDTSLDSSRLLAVCPAVPRRFFEAALQAFETGAA